MGFWDALRGLLASPAGSQEAGHNYWFYVRCSVCGETLKGRVDMRNELSVRDDEAGFLVRKTLIGSKRCYRPIEVTLYFDAGRHLTDREIQGGEFVEADDYQPETAG